MNTTERSGLRILMGRLGLVGLLLFSLAAQASLTVSKAIIDLQPGERTSDIMVSNPGDKTLYVLAEAARIVAPGTPAESRFSDPDPRKVGVLVTPRKFILEPGRSRVVRVQMMAPAQDADQVFRILVKPVANQQDMDSSGLTIQLAYDVLLIQRPANPAPNVTIETSETGVIVRNAGNTNVLLVDGRACRDVEYQDCDELSGKRLYAGAQVMIDLDPEIRLVEFNSRVAEHSRVLRWTR